MAGMFERACSFNRPIEKWDTSNVKNMKRMFFGAHLFAQSLAGWNMSQVYDIEFMFEGVFSSTAMQSLKERICRDDYGFRW